MTSLSSGKCYELVVEVRYGKDLENRKLIGSNAPYVKCTVGDQEKRTSAVADLANPCWNEQLKFYFKNIKDVSSSVHIGVKDDRILLPNPRLGDYIIKLDKQLLLDSMTENTPFVIHDGIINLQNADSGSLDIKMWFQYCNEESLKNFSKLESQLQSQVQSESELQTKSQLKSESLRQTTKSSNVGQMQYEEVNKSEFEKVPDVALQKNEFDFDNKDELKYKTMDKDEVHVLPTLHVEEKPVIIEKEIEFKKPVQIKQTILHQEKPVIVEQPIIRETHEHYREATDHIKTNETKVKERVSEQDVGNLDEQAILNLRQDRIDSYSDNTPITQHEKQFVQLETDVREKPTEVRKKEVVYEQPVEIQRTEIEKIKPKVVEDVTLSKEHIHQKVAPEVYVEDTTRTGINHEYYSQDTLESRDVTTSSNLNVNANEFVASAGQQQRRQEQQQQQQQQ